MKFVTEILIRFAHTDPAGIVFYPRYFEMINQTIEDWFAEIGFDFRTIHMDRGQGIPTVSVKADFHAASRLGDVLRFELAVERLGRSSIALAIEASCGGQARLSARPTLAYIGQTPFRSIAIPAEIRARMEDYRKPGDDASA